MKTTKKAISIVLAIITIISCYSFSFTSYAADTKYSVSLSSSSYVYDGKKKTPSVTVKKDKKVLKKGKDYTVTYPQGRTAIGQYTIKIKLKGKYKGTLQKSFKIIPKATFFIFVVNRDANKIKLIWNKVSNITGYDIQCSSNKDFKNPSGHNYYNSNTTSNTSVFPKNKTFYFRIRTYKTVKVNGKSTNIYSKWSKVEKATT